MIYKLRITIANWFLPKNLRINPYVPKMYINTLKDKMQYGGPRGQYK